jgi:PfaB family protein
MMFATGVWAQGDQAADRLKASDSFRARLAGSQLAVREYWGMSSDTGAETGELWSNYLVMCPLEKIQAALESESRVYLTHINTPRQVVIGGDPQACQRVLAKLRCSSLQAPFDYALHCEAMRSEFDALVDLHDWPVENVPPQLMYSAADYSAINIERHEISQKIGHMLTTPLDFPRLINKVYEDGARVFIEVGAGSNCARWIDESLKNSPHLALSLNRRGTDDYTTLVRSIARLHSHRVPLDMTRLYQISKERLSL